MEELAIRHLDAGAGFQTTNQIHLSYGLHIIILFINHSDNVSTELTHVTYKSNNTRVSLFSVNMRLLAVDNQG